MKNLKGAFSNFKMISVYLYRCFQCARLWAAYLSMFTCRIHHYLAAATAILLQKLSYPFKLAREGHPTCSSQTELKNSNCTSVGGMSLD